MKAAVIYERDGLPVYTDIDGPVLKREDEILVSVKAVALKHFDKSRATGKHYSSGEPGKKGRIVGGDGVGILPDGTRVYGMAITGMLAEKALIEKDRVVIIPDGVDDATAAALPNAVIGSAMALKFRAEIKPGNVVLINGASGFTGRIAIQMAKYYGAKKVVATGRNENSLAELLELGADEVIDLNKSDPDFTSAIKKLHDGTPIDMVIDYLWGNSAQLILSCFAGRGAFTHQTKYVSVGAVTGDTVLLSSQILRSTNLQISGSGLGSWTKEQVGLLFSNILPETLQLAAEGRLKVKTTTVHLKDIAGLWDIDVPGGNRLVVTL